MVCTSGREFLCLASTVSMCVGGEAREYFRGPFYDQKFASYYLFYENMKKFTNLMQLSIYLCSFSSTCFGLIGPSSGEMDITISLHMQHM